MEPMTDIRTHQRICPFCEQEELDQEGSAFGMRYVCDACGKYIEVPPDL